MCREGESLTVRRLERKIENEAGKQTDSCTCPESEKQTGRLTGR